MGTTIGHETIRTLIDHGVIPSPKPSEPKPTLNHLFATAVERGWQVTVTPQGIDDIPDDFGKPKEPPVAVEIDMGFEVAGCSGKPLLAAMAEATAAALETAPTGALDAAV